MRIVSYVISTPMDVGTLGDALSSLAHFSDHIYLIDGMQGRGTLCHYPLHTEPIRDWAMRQAEYRYGYPVNGIPTTEWRDVPISILEHEFVHPAAQRNWTLARIQELDHKADWVVWIDSDEACSWEFINGLRDTLDRMPSNIVGVTPQWLNLVQDFQHCVGGHHSSWLAHPRIHRLGAVKSFSNEWHEHMVIDRNNVVRWDVRIIHTRALWRRILLVQRGHPVIGNRRSVVMPEAPMFWDDANMEVVPHGITWPELHVPEGEIIPFPIEADAARVWDYQTGEQIGNV